jgi:hypothetical protein
MKFGRGALTIRSRAVLLLAVLPLAADQIPVRYLEGRIHGFLVLRDIENNILASGSVIQFTSGNRVTNEVAFHFKDDSFQQETAVYSQRQRFQLLSYHLIQKGRTFKHPLDLSLNTSSGQVVIQTEEDGKPKTITERMNLPPDLANGIVTTLLGDTDPKAAKTTVSMLVATPKPRIVKLEITPAAEDSFTVAGYPYKATRYNVHIQIGGLSGVIAPVVGKQPPDIQVWIAAGKAPGFVKSEGPLFEGGPVWRIELASPLWRQDEADRKR